MPSVAKTKEKQDLAEAEIYVLQGDNEPEIADIVQELKDRHATGGFGEMNLVQLDGRTVSRQDLANHMNVLPMGGGSRLVILDEALEFIKNKEDSTWLESLLGAMPVTTIVVLLVRDSQKYSRGNMVWQTVGPGHALHKVMKGLDRKVVWMEKPKPTRYKMSAWIADQADEMGAKMDGRAAAELANLVGDDLFQARQEIIKAASYAGEGQVITRDMVRLLCSPSRQEDIFAMVDAAGRRDPGKALSLLDDLLRDQPAPYVFSMVARQFRLLIITREIMQEGGDEKTIAAEANLHPFVAKKLADQAPRFSMVELEDIFRRLDKMDEQSKTGNATLEVMLEILISDLGKP